MVHRQLQHLRDKIKTLRYLRHNRPDPQGRGRPTDTIRHFTAEEIANLDESKHPEESYKRKIKETQQ